VPGKVNGSRHESAHCSHPGIIARSTVLGKLLKLFKGNIRQYGMIIALGLIVFMFQMLTGGILLKPLNITNLILQNGYVLILAIGMLPIIITGRIDLSVGSIVAFVGAVASIMMVNYKLPLVPTLFVSLFMGAAIGAWQGFWIAYVGIPAFITTLSGMLIFRGLTIAVLGGKSIGPFYASFRAISTSFIPDFFGTNTLNMTAIAAGLLMCLYLFISETVKRKDRKRYGFDVLPLWFFILKLLFLSAALMSLSYFMAAYNGIPSLLVLLVFLIIFYSFMTNSTVLGRRIYALGGNEAAARLSGIDTKKIIFFTNINMGVLAAIAGLVFAARLNAGTPKAGTGFELDAIAACFIGGASVSGGTGTIVGAVLGTLIMGVMNNGMSIIGVSVDYQQAIKPEIPGQL
jgi:putative multiple sugar transport system permease protein